MTDTAGVGPSCQIYLTLNCHRVIPLMMRRGRSGRRECRRLGLEGGQRCRLSQAVQYILQGGSCQGGGLLLHQKGRGWMLTIKREAEGDGRWPSGFRVK